MWCCRRFDRVTTTGTARAMRSVFFSPAVTTTRRPDTADLFVWTEPELSRRYAHARKVSGCLVVDPRRRFRRTPGTRSPSRDRSGSPRRDGRWRTDFSVPTSCFFFLPLYTLRCTHDRRSRSNAHRYRVCRRTMPFKLRLKKSRQYNVVSKSLYVICVELLDSTSIECTLSAESVGQECLDSVCQRLGLHQVIIDILRFECYAI